MKPKLQQLTRYWPIGLIVFAGFLLRIKGLTYQSLWLDELHTMNEADPSLSWKEMFRQLKCCDPHPPLYFITERIAFSLFGHTEFVARGISVIAGTASIAAIYWLGKELLNKNLGYFAAILVCVNPYNLFYSQEARPYIFAFLFAILSYLFFVRLVKSPTRNNSIGYAICTLLMLYSHHYGLFVVVSQAFIGSIFIWQENGAARKRMIKSFALSTVIVIVVYIPMIPFILEVSRIKSFWISTTDTAFLQTYFNEYFGGSAILKPVLVALLLVFLVRVAQENYKEPVKLRSNAMLSAFLILLSWVFITVLIPYIRSLIVIPMLFPRYTIVILPAIILAIAYGIELFSNNLIKWVIISLVVILSLINIIAEKKYYSAANKTQFREVTSFIIAENKANYPIINQHTLWHQQYYLNRMGSKATTVAGDKEFIIDSILSGKAKFGQRGFWITGFHNDKMISDEKLKAIDTGYILLKQKDLHDAWARLYITKMQRSDSLIILGENDFANGTVLPETQMVAIWTGTIQSEPILLQKGKYNLSILARGDAAAGVYPHLNIYINDKKVADFFVTAIMESRSFVIDHSVPGDVIIKIEMDNDLFQPGLADRNAFISRVILELNTAK